MTDLMLKSANDTVTVIGVFYDVQQTQEISRRDGKTRKKQVVMIVDDTKYMVQVTLWETVTGTVVTVPNQANAHCANRLGWPAQKLKLSSWTSQRHHPHLLRFQGKK